MSNTETLKKYLLTKENSYLLDDNNNGKTIMLSGAWGSGKTHFWQNEIEPKLKDKLKEKAYVYVSLYGKESLSDIKSDVYLSASGKNLLSTEVSTFGMEALSAIKDSELAVGKVLKAGKGLIDSKKMQKGINKLKKGGVICFDDFERKSKNVDLNDLFGFISQLAINLECKVIIILNSEVFEDEEAKIFSRVKEKTISKFFYFKPSPEELFKSISNDSKYNKLSDDDKKYILSAIKETKELNARIYRQVLDNCLEWLKVKEGIDAKIIRVLVLSTFNFVLHHMILSYETIQSIHGNMNLIYNETIKDYPYLIKDKLENITMSIAGYSETEETYLKEIKLISNTILITKLEQEISRLDRDTKQPLYTETTQIEIRKWIHAHQQELIALCTYGYILYFMDEVNKTTYSTIINFIESGIILP